MPAAVAPLESSIARSRRSRWCRGAGRSGMAGLLSSAGRDGQDASGTSRRTWHGPGRGARGLVLLTLSVNGFELALAGAAGDQGLRQRRAGHADAPLARQVQASRFREVVVRL